MWNLYYDVKSYESRESVKLPFIHFGREITGELSQSTRREWLVTNGIGGYAMGTVCGVRTRRYHGLLIAATRPPVGRVLTVAELDVWVTVRGYRIPLSTHLWRPAESGSDVIFPDGYHHLERFHLDGLIPTFIYTVGEVQIVRRVWMQHGKNTVYVTYTYRRGTNPITINITPLCTCRDHHAVRRGKWEVKVRPLMSGVEVSSRVHSINGAESRHCLYRMLSNTGQVKLKGDGDDEPGVEWWWGAHLPQEKYRGLESTEDLFAPVEFKAELKPGDTLAFVVTAEDDPPMPWDKALEDERERQRRLLGRFGRPAPDWIRQLVLAADQFVVRRDVGERPGSSVIAGYPWFEDWGRDTMIALPGLMLTTGRYEDAATTLRTFARCIDRGMLPNRFPDAGKEPEYNTVDAALWYFNAAYAYLRETNDHDLACELYPVLSEIIRWYRHGTRYGIKVDEDDGLLYAGESGMQLTWMDARVDGRVITPRIGKPVEINALWYNALRVMEWLADGLDKGEESATFKEMADRAKASFQERFWYEDGGYLYDVVDTPDGDDPTLRPNQLLALSLPHPLIEGERARSVIEACASSLLTSMGLRSLSPTEAAYAGRYGGSPAARDEAYHQGTVWAWLIGPFVSAYFRAYGDADGALSFLLPFADHLLDHGLGTVSEIFDGLPPHTPRGCVAQAWSVGEILRAWDEIETARNEGLEPPPNGYWHAIW